MVERGGVSLSPDNGSSKYGGTGSGENNSFTLMRNVDKGIRSVYFNAGRSKKKHFCSNVISTAKYNMLTFLPIFLFEQFRKAFNIFFLIISCFQQIPNVSPTGQFTTLLPLLFILSVAAVKEIIEDYARHKRDKETNNRKCLVFSIENKVFESKLWSQVEVGDVVRVVSGSFFPADIVLFSSSEPLGMCYIETANLDGETNLKVRQALQATLAFGTEEKIFKTSGCVVCEGPNRHLYSFSGNIHLDAIGKAFPVGSDQVLLRGAKLRNTKFVHGVVIYTGSDTKLMQNANRAPLKQSNVDRIANRQIWFLLILLILLALGSAAGSWIWQTTDEDRWYLGENGVTSMDLFLSVLTFMVLYNNLVPISLLVTLEVVKFIQAFFINDDLDMYYGKTDTPALARTSNLNEELGQVKYIFSDKTGTLTQNQMVFKKCSVDGIKYGDISREKFDDVNFKAKVRSTGVDSAPVREFMLALALCHTVVPEIENNTIKYQASSPDEYALVEAAKAMGCKFVERTPDYVVVEAWGRKEKYEIINVLEFNSARKRMSVILKSPDGRLVLYCKGADNVIYERLAPTSDRLHKDATLLHLEQFAVEGLRTLCFSSVAVDHHFYQVWNQQYYYPASTSVSNREAMLDEAYEKIEKNLKLLGASAIEDKLQDGVPEAIATLSKADIKIWVLTGDKQETAVNIGFACNLITPRMKHIVLNHRRVMDTQMRIKQAMVDVSEELVNQRHDFVLVVSGVCLVHCMAKGVQPQFLDLALSCKSVICCRVSPIQKAEIVEMVKTNCKAITLAIGDGANDVSMIQAAHVGVGISGFEGLQAANSSDYSIAQFAYLKTLLLVHGSWNYLRLAKCILFSFYKNICLYLIELWFLFFNGFSGQILFDRWAITLYNVIFTLLPPFSLGLFERTSSKKCMLKYPQLYSVSQKAAKFNSFEFWKMFLNASLHSALLFALPAYAFRHDVLRKNGSTGGYLYIGNFVFTYVVVTVCMKAALETGTWTVFAFLSIFGSILSWFVVLVGYSLLYPTLSFASDMSGQGANIVNTPMFWFGLIFVPTAVLFKDILWKVFRPHFKPSIVDKVEDAERRNVSLEQVGKTEMETLATPSEVYYLSNGNRDNKRSMSPKNEKYNSNIHKQSLSPKPKPVVNEESLSELEAYVEAPAEYKSGSSFRERRTSNFETAKSPIP